MEVLEAKTVLGASSSISTSVFEKGKIDITSFNVESSSSTSSSSPPKPLLIVTPTIKGTYPVIVFFHGFYFRNSFYALLLQHIASHGFILIAPQLYFYIPSSGPDEIDNAAKVINWLPTGLQSLLPEKVESNLLKLSLIGHSRGGKTAFALALGHGNPSLKFSALLGLDPVAGPSKCLRTQPHILTYVPRSFDISVPITVIGTGLGSEKRNFITPPCAPEGVNHEEFFNECKPPCAYFIVKEFGHVDMLDDDPSGLIGELSGCVCRNGKGSRDLMRRTCGGIVVAFLKACLDDDKEDFTTIFAHPDLAPALLDPVKFIGE